MNLKKYYKKLLLIIISFTLFTVFIACDRGGVFTIESANALMYLKFSEEINIGKADFEGKITISTQTTVDTTTTYEIIKVIDLNIIEIDSVTYRVIDAIEVPFDEILFLEIEATFGTDDHIGSTTATFESGESTEIIVEMIEVTNPSPICNITSPTDGASFTIGDIINISAYATDIGDGYVSEVRFYQNDSLLYTAAALPFEFNWDTTGETAGNIVLKVIAIDNESAETESSVSVTLTEGSSFTPQMILIPEGTFDMGDFFGEGQADELPVHTVTLDSFYIANAEVTQLEYENIMGVNPSSTSFGIGNNYPVNTVSYYDIMVFCNTRSINESLSPCYTILGSTNPADWGAIPTINDTDWNAVVCDFSANGYRLPTESEWEYAAKGGESWSDSLRYAGCHETSDLTDYAWYNANTSITSHEVGTKLPNQLGLYDMSGNVWEWCYDWYGSTYYGSSPASNPLGPITGSRRTGRGGSWSNLADFSRNAYRLTYLPSSTPDLMGFRLSRTADGTHVNNSPTCDITSPAGGTNFTIGDNVNISATATDSDGSISEVRFYQNDNLLSTDTASPYEYDWDTTGETAGNVVIKAIAVDNENAETENTVSVTLASGSFIPQMVLIPEGSFDMGDLFNEGETIELPVHNVTLSSFYLANAEVTQLEYENTMGSNPSIGTGIGNNYPVNMVSYYDMMVFCNTKSISENLTPCYTIEGSTNPEDWGAVPSGNHGLWNSVICNFDADGYRLPTEAEWEYAAKGGNNWTDNLRYSGCSTESELPDYAWYEDNNSSLGTKEVGTRLPNQLGLYDMNGNLWEYCFDWYDTNYYSSSPNNNPEGPASGSSRILRGGTHNFTAYYLRVSYRYGGTPYEDRAGVGFRLARSALSSNIPPTCNITSPTGGANFTIGDNINISATATDSDGSITEVRFYQNDNLLSTDTASPYEYNWDTTGEIAGNVVIKAIAVDNENAETENTVSITLASGSSFTPQMILIQNGTFNMGDFFNEGNTHELPVHTVTLDGFYIANAEVTQLEYENIMGTNPSNISYGIGDNYPVNTVSYYDIMVFCNITSVNEGFNPCYTILGSTNPNDWGIVPTSTNIDWDAVVCNFSANGYRLPTEAEWEYAAKGGENWDDNMRYSGCLDESELSNYAWWNANQTGISHEIGTKSPNQIGLYDMSGNVFEWCYDWYGSSYYGSSPSSNPLGPVSGTFRIYRGGYWNNFSGNLRNADRVGLYPYSRDLDKGFRLTRTFISSGQTNNPPTCNIISPADGTNFTIGDNINISVTATDNDGSISIVRFYQNEDLLHFTTAPPYEYNWSTTGETAGNVVLKAIAVDNENAETENTVSVILVDGSFTPQMISIPEGTFDMGDYFGEGDANELPVHTVNLDSFYITNTEVTQLEYEDIMGVNPSVYGVGDNYPVNTVSYYDIMVFCNKASISTGLTPCYTILGSTDPADWGSIPIQPDLDWNAVICDFSANGYRLPTEAEWEYCAKGGISWADNMRYSGCLDESDLTNYGWYTGNQTGTSQEVENKLPNQLGLFDMSGNMWEWCWDWYDNSYYASSPVNNPTGPASSSQRVLRGGGWNDSATSLRISGRYGNNSYYDYHTVGFRIARTAE